MAAPAFTERDVQKAVAGAIKGGLQIGRVEIDRSTGRIVIVAAGNEPEPEDEIAAWLREHGGD